MTPDLIERLRLGNGTSPDHLLLLEAADALEKSVECMCGICKLTQRNPLTDEEIYAMCKDFHNWAEWDEYQKLWFDLCRAIEAAHGIGDKT